MPNDLLQITKAVKFVCRLFPEIGLNVLWIESKNICEKFYTDWRVMFSFLAKYWTMKFGWNLLGIYSFFVKELKNEPNFLIAFGSFSYVNQT